MYVIGTVESNCDWGACNYVDAITMGMMQWYGTRARNLLERGRTADPEGWDTFSTSAPTLARQVQANTVNWTTRYLSTAEGNAWKTWAQRDKNHAFQEAQWDADWNGYQSTMSNYGFPARNVKEAYHVGVCLSSIPRSGAAGARVMLGYRHTGIDLHHDIGGWYTRPIPQPIHHRI